MIEQKRFTITICDNYRRILKDRDSSLVITLRGMCSEAEVKLCDTLNSLHKEIEELKKENAMLKTTIARNEAYIERMKHKGEWRK